MIKTEDAETNVRLAFLDRTEHDGMTFKAADLRDVTGYDVSTLTAQKTQAETETARAVPDVHENAHNAWAKAQMDYSLEESDFVTGRKSGTNFQLGFVVAADSERPLTKK